MDLTFLDNLSFRQYFMQMRLEEPSNFHYFHGPALNSLLCKALNQSSLGKNIVIFPVEVGKVDYQAGDLYNFSYTVFFDSGDFGARIRDALIARSAFRDNTGPYFRFSVVDYSEIFTPSMADLQDWLGKCDDVAIRFMTPLRMERQNPKTGKTYFDPGYFEPDRFFQLLYNRIYDLNKLSGKPVPEYQSPDITDFSIVDRNLIWVDAPYTSLKKTFGGIIGTVRLRLNPQDYWRKVLILGQFTHAGNNSAKGFGKYIIDEPEFHSLLTKPAMSVLDRVVRDENLKEAFREVKANSEVPGTDGQSINEFEAGLFDNLKRLKKEIVTGKYRSEDLRGIILPVNEKKVRALAIPSVRDRVFQRAACQILAPAVDQLLEDCSFAYRRGFSREGAAKAIQQAYNEGYRYVLESDIEAFFDNVDWSLLFRKLDTLLFNDPIVPIIHRWIMQTVEYNGQKVQRVRGLPPGSAISPLLANLLLDEFDEQLGDDFRLIRYADDFVILCKTKEDAENALTQAESVVKQLKLELKPSKTNLTNFDIGFQYLGYIFCKSAVLETKKKSGKEKTKPVMIPVPDIVPKNSWIANVDFRKIKEIHPVLYGNKKEFALIDSSHQDRKAFPVYLSDSEVFARLSYQTLIITNHDHCGKPGRKIPLSQIKFIVDYGKPSITLPAVIELSRRNIPTYFCRRTGETYCVVPASQTDYNIWQKQLEKSLDKRFVIGFAREIVRAKIHNYAVIARRQQWNDSILQQFSLMEDRCEQEDDMDSLRGFEGKSAAIYFKTLAEQLPQEFNFNGRQKHPPTDPINALLSFGYSVLYHHLATTLMGNNLNPAIGWYHFSHDRYLALACDLQEEFRHIIDSLVIQMVHRGQVNSSDYFRSEKMKYPFLMKKDFQSKYISLIEDRLLTKFTHLESETEIDLLGLFDYQARQIIELCRGKQEKYRPYRIH